MIRILKVRYFVVLFVITVLLSISSVEAEPTPQDLGNGQYYIKGKNYDKTITERDGPDKVVWKSHYERMYDYTDSKGNPVYVDFKTENTADYFNFNSAGISLSFDKTNCIMHMFEPGKITNGESSRMKLSHVLKEALNSTDVWHDADVNTAPCAFSTQETGETVTITATKSNSNGTFQIIHDIASRQYEWTYKYTLENSDLSDQYKYGATFVCDGSECGTISVDGQAISEGQTLEKNNIVGKDITVGSKIFDTKEREHGYTWALKRPGPEKMVVDFTHAKGALSTGQTMVIDPTYSQTEDTDGSIGGDGVADASCSPTAVSNDAYSRIVMRASSDSDSDSCEGEYNEFDTSSIPTGQSFDSGSLEWDHVESGPGPITGTCVLRFLDLDMSTASDQDIYDAVVLGTGSNFSVLETGMTECQSTQTITVTFDSSDLNILEADADADDKMAFGYFLDDPDARTGSLQLTNDNSFDSATLTIEYSEDTGVFSPGPPINPNVSILNRSAFNFTWTPDNATGVDGYAIFRNTTTSDFIHITNTGNVSSFADNTRTFGDENCYKASAFSINNGTNSTTACQALSAPTNATITLSTGNVGDVEQVNATVRITNGSGSLDLTQSRLFVNGTGDDTNSTTQTMTNNTVVDTGPFWFRMTNDNLFNFTVAITIENHTGFNQHNTVVIESQGTTDRRDYDPDYKNALTSGLGQYNYTLQRTPDQEEVTVRVNRISVPSGETWTLNCLLQNQQEAIFTNNTGTWVNRTGVGYYNASISSLSTSHLYGQCFNPDDPVFTFVSYTNSSLALLGIQSFDQSYGEFLGVPVGVFFILMAAGAASPRTAPTWIVVILGMVGVMTTIGFFTLDANVWALALILGLLGLMVGRKFI